MFPLTRLIVAPALALSLLLGAPAAPAFADAGALSTSIAADSLPEKKQTKSGLYLTAAEAAEVVAARDDILLIDVRTPEETVLVGYPKALDANIPLVLFDASHAWNAKKSTYKTAPNPDFIAATQQFLEGKSPSAVLVMCRSGSRSAAAVNKMIEAGIDLPLYSVVDGFEGDRNKDGERLVNGWKNAGAAWTTKPHPDLLIQVQ